MNENSTLLRVEGLVKYYEIKKGLFSPRVLVKAVDGVSFEVNTLENMALVGESGCGKTTIARIILRLTHPTIGKVFLLDMDIFSLSRNEKHLMPRLVQMIFQNAYESLNPRKKVKNIISTPLRLNTTLSREQVENRVLELLSDVMLTPAETYAERYPHQLSGGEKQRVAIARALSLKPRLIVADEPTSALDVSIRGDIINLFKDLQRKYSTTYLLITHDLATAKSLCSRVAVMYLGKIVEYGPISSVFNKPLHPYTMALLAATQSPDPRKARTRQAPNISGDVPSPINPPSGCRFNPRCPYAWDVCRKVEPKLEFVDGREVACHLYTQSKQTI